MQMYFACGNVVHVYSYVFAVTAVPTPKFTGYRPIAEVRMPHFRAVKKASVAHVKTKL